MSVSRTDVAARAARAADSSTRVLQNLGHQLSFYARSLGWAGRTVKRYPKEVLRLLSEVSLGSGALALIGGTVVVVGFLTAAAGVEVGLQGYTSLGNIGVSALSGFVAAYVNTREAAPAIAGIALTATVGAGFTAQLGAMRVSEEIDALEVMAIPSIPYLVTTRIIAGLFAVIPLYAVALVMSYASTRVVVTVGFGQSAGSYDHYFATFLIPIDILWSFLKAALMALVVISVCCYYGFNASGGPAGVGTAVGRAVRSSLISVMVIDLLFGLAVWGGPFDRPYRDMTTHRVRYSLYGVAFIVAVIALVVLSILQYNRAFDSAATVHLESPRAGLLLDDGAAVKLRGVTIGRVSGLRPTGSGAAMDLEIDPDQLHLVPAGASAQIVPPTLFGGKYVDLIAPAGPASTDHLAAGATIHASHVTVEINTTFQHLMALLQATKPAQVSAALSALANALDGRGEQAGRLLTQINVYLGQINPQLGLLRRDLHLARPVLGAYADLAPSLLDTARHVTRTSNSIQNNQASLDAFLLSLTSVAHHTTTFVDRNKHNLTTALDVLQPGVRVLAEYAPEFPCFFRGLAKAIPLAEAAIGGKNPGLGVLAQFLPPQTPYKYPRDLPKIGADTGPRCYGLPDIPMGKQVPNQTFDVGPNPYNSSSQTPGLTVPSLLELLFGPIEGASG